MSYNLFLDDHRDPIDAVRYMHTRIAQLNPVYINEGWLIARNFDEFVKIIQNNGMPNKISFDHDLAQEHYQFNELTEFEGYCINYSTYKEKTGYDALKWVVNLHMDMEENDFPLIFLHTQNPSGYENMRAYLVNYYKQVLKNIRRSSLFETIYDIY